MYLYCLEEFWVHLLNDLYQQQKLPPCLPASLPASTLPPCLPFSVSICVSRYISRSPSLALRLSLSVSRSPSLARRLSLSVSRSPSLALRLSLSVSRSPSLALRLSLSVSRSPSLPLCLSLSASHSLSLALCLTLSLSLALSLSLSLLPSLPTSLPHPSLSSYLYPFLYLPSYLPPSYPPSPLLPFLLLRSSLLCLCVTLYLTHFPYFFPLFSDRLHPSSSSFSPSTRFFTHSLILIQSHMDSVMAICTYAHERRSYLCHTKQLCNTCHASLTLSQFNTDNAIL